MFETIGFCGIFVLFLITSLFATVYQLVLRSWYYFRDRNVKCVRGVPLLGSTYKSIIGLEPSAISYRRCYESFPNEKFIGIFDFGGRTSYLIRDPDLIKQLLYNDLSNFTNQDSFFDVIGLKWRQMQPTTNPILSNKRLQSMHTTIVKCSHQFIAALKEADKIAKIFDLHDLFSRFANDIYATAIFSVEVDSLRDTNNEFYKASCSLSEFRYLDALTFLASLSFPSLPKFFEFIISGEKNANNYIRQIVDAKIRARRNNHDYSDMIDLLNKAQDGEMKDNGSEDKINVGFAAYTESKIGGSHTDKQSMAGDDLVTRCLTFFLGGTSTVSAIACFMFHELALNPEIQEKLYSEIKELNGEPLTYDILPKLKYLDAVVCETLRRWCPIPFIERSCSRAYVLEYDEGKVELQVGNGIFISPYALHMDDKYFKNPIKFDPERFNDENRSLIRTGTYLPFEPRNVDGSRFAIITVKTIAFHLLSEFYIDKSYKTQDPLKLKSLPLLMDADKGFFVELRRRHPDRTPYKSQVFT